MITMKENLNVPEPDQVIETRRLHVPSLGVLLSDVLEYLEATGHGGHDLAWLIRKHKTRLDSALVDELLARVNKRLDPDDPRQPTATIDVRIRNCLFDVGKMTRIRGV